MSKFFGGAPGRAAIRSIWPITTVSGGAVHDDRHLFEFLILKGAQAGLSWITILRKRESYRMAFAGLDFGTVARFDGVSR
jgi:3-methyladenine DNA glycosylase Tag